MRSLTLIFALAALIFSTPARADMRGGLPIGEVAPDGTVTPLDGTPSLLSTLQGDRVMLLQIFKTTCHYCQDEVPQVNEIHRRIDKSKVALVCVSLREAEAAVRKFIPKYGVEYPLNFDTAATLQRPFNLQAVPSYFILDRGRVVRFQGHQFTADDILQKLESLQ